MRAVPGTVELERFFNVPVRDVFAAWSSADAMLKWSAMPDDWTMRCESFALEVGHEDRWWFGQDGGTEYLNCNRYVEIDAGHRIVYTTTLSQAGQPSFAGAVSVTFSEEDGGCRLSLLETGVHLSGDDGAGHREGWEGMLEALGGYLAGPAAAPRNEMASS